MKRFLVIVPTIAAIFLTGCSKPKVNTDQGPEVPTPTPAPRAPDPTPAPKVVATPAPTPVPKRLVPDGYLLALQRISVTSDEGVFSVPPGTQLKIVKTTETGFVVTDGKREFPVLPAQVTNEIDTAMTAAQQHAAAQNPNTGLTPAQIAARNAEIKARQAKEGAAAEAALLDLRIRELQAKAVALQAEIQSLSNTIATQTRDTLDPTLRATWLRRLTAAREAKFAVDAELNKLRK